MKLDIFNTFRLVGGTGLSLQLGHRVSEDIDLFTEAECGSLDFDSIDGILKAQFTYFETFDVGMIGHGKSYFIGESSDTSVKLDICCTDPFIRPVLYADGIRLAEIEDIIAMKVAMVGGGGRKKDFWDVHELLNKYSIGRMIELHKERYPFTHNKKDILANFKKIENADADFDPVCIKGKHWELIKLDILDTLMTPG